MKGEAKTCFIPLIHALILGTWTNLSQSLNQPDYRDFHNQKTGVDSVTMQDARGNNKLPV